MENNIIQLNTDIYGLHSYQDKSGNDITFNVFFTKEKEDTHLTQLIVQAMVNEEVAGYICLIYLSEENKKNYYNNTWEFYYNQKMSVSLKNLFYNDWSSFCKETKKSFNTDIHTVEDFKNFVNIRFDNDYKKFISYYLNKPYPEIVTIYSDNDIYCKDFSSYPFFNMKRKATNFLNKGIANALYHCACHILKKDRLYLHASNSQTVDGQRMWKCLEKNSKFLMLSDNYWDNLTTDRKNIIQIQRKCITI